MKQLINKIKEFFTKRAENKAIDRYIRTGNSFGDAVSYLYMGECVGFKEILAAWEHWEQEIVKYGYRPFDLDIFVGSGGYGKQSPELEKLKDGEKPIFHAKIYHDKFLGKVKPVLDLNEVMKGQTVTAQYSLPSTKQ